MKTPILLLLQKLLIRQPEKEEPAVRKRCLPLEFVEQILVRLREECSRHSSFTRYILQPTLRAAALIFRDWSSVLKTQLYKEILLSSSKALERLADSLTKFKHLRPLVHQFYFSNPSNLINFSEIIIADRHSHDSLHSATDTANLDRVYKC